MKRTIEPSALNSKILSAYDSGNLKQYNRRMREDLFNDEDYDEDEDDDESGEFCSFKVEKCRKLLNDPKLSLKKRYNHRKWLDKALGLKRLYKYAEQALKPGAKKTSLAHLVDPQEIAAVFLALRKMTVQLRVVRSFDDFIALVLDYFLRYNPEANEKRFMERKKRMKFKMRSLGARISRRTELFEKKNARRIVLTGHGFFHRNVRPIKVPKGKRIHFYTAPGSVLDARDSMLIEGYSGTGRLIKPEHTVGEGRTVEDYFLCFPYGLPINTRKMSRYDQIMVSSKTRGISLSVLLKDPRCRLATDIHWCACRIDAGASDITKYQLKSNNKYLYGDFSKGPVTFMTDRGKELKYAIR